MPHSAPNSSQHVNPSDNHQSSATTEHTQPPPFLPHPHWRAASHLRATLPVPPSRLITPFTSTITSSSSYLADSLNVYEGRFARNGDGLRLFCGWCCAQELAGRTSRRRRRKSPRRRPRRDTDDSGGTPSFGDFALHDLRAGEVVLACEWDDGSAVHSLPALLKTTGMFP